MLGVGVAQTDPHPRVRTNFSKHSVCACFVYLCAASAGRVDPTRAENPHLIRGSGRVGKIERGDGSGRVRLDGRRVGSVREVWAASNTGF